jgi:uncharacterized phosphosugar-binding protein
MIAAFHREVSRVLETFVETQGKTLETVASVIADHMEEGGILYTIGTGHSHMVGEEFYARAGGLACIRLIAPMELTLGDHPLKSTVIERIADYAHVILTQYPIGQKDLVMISSNSGRNAMIVELALECRRRGITAIGFTNLTHSRQVTSRHTSGKRLFEICDIVLDNCGCEGDAAMDIPGVRGKMGASSSLVGMFMAQSLGMEIAREMAKRGMEVPVFLSANVDAGDDWNQKIMEEYYGI